MKLTGKHLYPIHRAPLWEKQGLCQWLYRGTQAKEMRGNEEEEAGNRGSKTSGLSSLLKLQQSHFGSFRKKTGMWWVNDVIAPLIFSLISLFLFCSKWSPTFYYLYLFCSFFSPHTALLTSSFSASSIQFGTLYQCIGDLCTFASEWYSSQTWKCVTQKSSI